MTEFLLRYKMPEELDTPHQEAKYQESMMHLAIKIQAKAKKIFNREVAFEVRPFDDNHGQPDISVTGWVTDNHDLHSIKIQHAQMEILTLMQNETFEHQIVSCSWQGVRGSWGTSTGLRLIPPSH